VTCKYGCQRVHEPYLSNHHRDLSFQYAVIVGGSNDNKQTVGLESGLKSVFAGLGLGLGKICNQLPSPLSIFTVHICSVLFSPVTCQPVSYTQPQISVIYLIFTAELTHGLACSDCIYIVLIFLLLVNTAIKDLDLDLELLDLDLDVDTESCTLNCWTGTRLGLDCC